MRWPTIGSVTLMVALALALSPDTLLASPSDGYFDSAGVQIHYVEEGAGETVILVHGYTNSVQDWIRVGVFSALAKQYHVVALDCRGHGQSGKPHSAKAYGREMGQDIVRLLDHIGVRQAHVVGYSMGAGIVAQLLTVNPERFLTATLGGNAGRRAWTEDEEKSSALEAAEMEEGTLRRIITRLAPVGGPPPTEEQIAQTSARLLAGQDNIALAAIERSRREFVETADQIAAAKVPVLGLVGSLDPSLTVFNDLKRAMPQLRLVVIPGASHGAAPGRPEFVQTLLKFLHDPASVHP